MAQEHYDFVQIMKDWKRMCIEMERLYPFKENLDCCQYCPLKPGSFCRAIFDYKPEDKQDFALVASRVARWAEENPAPPRPTWRDLFCAGTLDLDDLVPEEIEAELDFSTKGND